MANDVKKEIIDDDLENTLLDNFKKEFEDGYREYGLSVIRDRALPDIRDGLKPVHRRILYSMFNSGYLHTKTTYKSARIVGEIIGKYHPHGDSAVYETMVAMAQPWVYRYPLIYGQGNFGSIDGDSPAAMRYSEARLMEYSSLYVNSELKMDSVDFVPNYDEMETEPLVVPAQVPNLILNGGTGIAVGYSSGFMPHNLKEVMDLCVKFIENRCLNKEQRKNIIAIDEIMSCLKGPDFPTGGTIAIKEEKLRDIYLTGKGSVTIRSKVFKEDMGGNKWQLVISEIPYFIKKEAMILNISDQMRDGAESDKLKTNKKNNGLHLIIDDIRDETDKHGMRIVIIPKSSKIDFNDFRDHLFVTTNMQKNFSVNMNALVEGSGKYRIPKMLSMEDALNGFLDFQDECVLRKTKFRLNKVEQRLHILDGFLIAFSNIEEVIRIVRKESKPKEKLMERFLLSKEQVDAIIELRIRSLSKINEDDIEVEIGVLNKEKRHLVKLIESKRYRLNKTIDNFKNISAKYSDERRSVIDFEFKQALILDANVRIQKEPAMAILTEEGWIKYVKGNADLNKVKLRAGSVIKRSVSGYTNDNVVFISNTGKVFSTLMANLPSGRTDGSHLSSIFDLGSEKIIEMLIVDAEKEYTYTGDMGHTVRVMGSSLIVKLKKGKAVFSKDGIKDKMFIEPSSDNDGILFITNENKASVVKLDEFYVKNGGKGMQSIPKRSWLKAAALVKISSNSIKIGGKVIKIDFSDYLVSRAKAPRRVVSASFIKKISER